MQWVQWVPVMQLSVWPIRHSQTHFWSQTDQEVGASWLVLSCLSVRTQPGSPASGAIRFRASQISLPINPSLRHPRHQTSSVYSFSAEHFSNSTSNLCIYPINSLILHHLIFVMGWFWAEPTPLAARTPSGHPPVVGDKAPPVCSLSPVNMAYDLLSNSFS